MDFRDLLTEFRQVFKRYNARYDLNHDGKVNFEDVFIVIRCMRHHDDHSDDHQDDG